MNDVVLGGAASRRLATVRVEHEDDEGCGHSFPFPPPYARPCLHPTHALPNHNRVVCTRFTRLARLSKHLNIKRKHCVNQSMGILLKCSEPLLARFCGLWLSPFGHILRGHRCLSALKRKLPSLSACVASRAHVLSLRARSLKTLLMTALLKANRLKILPLNQPNADRQLPKFWNLSNWHV